MKMILFRQRNKYPDFFRDVIGLFFLKNKIRGNFIRYASITLSLTLFLNVNLIHASNNSTQKVWIDFIEESDTLFVKGLFVNLSENKNDYKWEMNIHKEMANDSLFDKSEKGKFIAEPFFPKIIVETKIDLKKREYFIIVFNVFNLKNKLIGTDTLFSIKVNPSLTKPKPTQPIAKLELQKPKRTLDALEIDGLILDETRSKIGRDFYEMFFNKWSQPLGAKDFLITITEMPARGIGARISIQVNGNIVLYRFLQPRIELIEEQANISISYVKQYLLRNENMKQDMEAGDQMGNGVY